MPASHPVLLLEATSVAHGLRILWENVTQVEDPLTVQALTFLTQLGILSLLRYNESLQSFYGWIALHSVNVPSIRSFNVHAFPICVCVCVCLAGILLAVRKKSSYFSQRSTCVEDSDLRRVNLQEGGHICAQSRLYVEAQKPWMRKPVSKREGVPSSVGQGPRREAAT